jgi:archaellum component FlaC
VEELKEYWSIIVFIVTTILHVGMLISEFRSIRKTMDDSGVRIKKLEDEVKDLKHKVDTVETSTKLAHSEMMNTISSQLTNVAHSLEKVSDLVSNVAKRIENLEKERKDELMTELETLRESVTPSTKVRVRRKIVKG